MESPRELWKIQMPRSTPRDLDLIGWGKVLKRYCLKAPQMILMILMLRTTALKEDKIHKFPCSPTENGGLQPLSENLHLSQDGSVMSKWHKIWNQETWALISHLSFSGWVINIEQMSPVKRGIIVISLSYLPGFGAELNKTRSCRRKPENAQA